MAFQSLKTTEVMTFNQAGQELIGHYSGTQENQGKDNNSKVHSIELEDGTIKQFWGSMIIDELIDKIKIGDFVKVSYLGLQQPKKAGGRPYHDYDLGVDPERSKAMAVPNIPVEPQAQDEFPGATF